MTIEDNFANFALDAKVSFQVDDHYPFSRRSYNIDVEQTSSHFVSKTSFYFVNINLSSF